MRKQCCSQHKILLPCAALRILIMRRVLFCCNHFFHPFQKNAFIILSQRHNFQLLFVFKSFFVCAVRARMYMYGFFVFFYCDALFCLKNKINECFVLLLTPFFLRCVIVIPWNNCNTHQLTLLKNNAFQFLVSHHLFRAL